LSLEELMASRAGIEDLAERNLEGVAIYQGR